MSNPNDSFRNEAPDPSLERADALLRVRANSIDTAPRPGFREALRLRLLDLLAAPVRRMSRFKFVAALLPALIVLIVAVLVFQPFFGVQTVYAYDQFTLSPESSDALGVAPNTTYLLESRDAVSASDIERLLTVKSDEDIGYRVEQISDTRLRVALDQPLRPEEIVRFGLSTTTAWPNGEPATRDYNWAFQVAGDFRVASTIPGDYVSGVPLDTGIEFNLSYENVDPDAFAEALEISPSVSGHMESSRRAFVFVPDAPLQPRTLYTVTLKGTLPLEGSDETLGEDYAFRFETSQDYERGYQFRLDDHYQTVTPRGTVAFQFGEWGASEPADGPFKAAVYRLGSFDAYLSALKTAQELDWRMAVSAQDLFDIASATPAFSYDLQAIESYGSYLVLPDALPEGYYLADISHGAAHDWALVASSDVTAYVSRAVNETLFWINDAATGQPVAGARVQYQGDDEHATTNSDGLGSVHSKETQSNVVEIRSGERATAVVLQSNFLVEDGKEGPSWKTQRAPQSRQDEFWAYLYTDRPTYRPDDTIKFWGYLETRDGRRPTQVRADIGFDSVAVDVTPDGTFAGELKARGAEANYYALGIYPVLPGSPEASETPAISRSVSVSEYVKPAYTLSIETDVDAAFQGETVGFTVRGTYFEGTPVKNLPLVVTVGCDQVVSVMLDETGTARGSFVCSPSDAGHGPNATWVSARPARPEEGQIETGTNFLLFGPRVYLDVDQDTTKAENGTGKVRLTVRNVQAVDSMDPKTFGPTVRAGQAVNGKITEITYERHETGTSYDFVRKQVVPEYRYERKEKEVAAFTAYSDANGLVEYSFPAANPDANYEVDLWAVDENGNSDRVETFVWVRQEFEYGGEPSENLSFHNDDGTAEEQWNFPGYEVGDQVHLSVYQNNESFVVPGAGRFLYYQAQQGIRETEVSRSSRYAFPFESSDVPNVGVYGVFFADGAYRQIGQQGWWYGSSGYAVRYDSSRSELAVSVTSDQARYVPGGIVTLAVHVQDADGRPVQAEVNMNVVDEAYYAIYPEEVSPLGELYRWVDDGVFVTVVTQDAMTVASAGAEKGGGGDRALGRFTFKDNAAFELVRTDSAGNGTMRFTLPDNVTSWRVTAQALNADKKQAGDTLVDVDASLPFFIDPVLRDSYLDDDLPTMLVRVAGTDLSPADSVAYTVAIPDAAFEQAVTAAAGDTVRVDLPRLAIGTHDVTVSATSGLFEDRMTRSVRILPSRLLKPVISSAEGNSSDAFATIGGADDRYTEITFMDAGVGRYYGELEALAGWWGDRADEALTRTEATKLLNDAFGEERSVPEFSASSYEDAAVRLLPYGSGDFDLSARVALLGEDMPFDADELRNYFRAMIDDRSRTLTPRERAMAFAALAALGEPVLAEFQRLAPALGDDPDVRLWVALGLQASGDDEGARAIYRELLAEIREKAGYLYLDADSPDDTAQRTALLAVLAGALNEPERDRIHDFVVYQSAANVTLPLERLLYVKKTLPHLIAGETEFSYVLRGERTTETVGRGSAISILASAEDRARLDVEVARGRLMAVSRYQAPVVDPNAPVDPDIGVSRRYGAENVVGTSFSEGQLVRVELPYAIAASNCGATAAVEANGGIEEFPADALRDSTAEPIPCESYQVTDVLPSGLSIITPAASFQYGTTWQEDNSCYDFPAKIDGQRISFFVSPDGDTACRNKTLTYYARVVTPGIYEAEPAYIRSVRNLEMNNHSEAQTIVIAQ